MNKIVVNIQSYAENVRLCVRDPLGDEDAWVERSQPGQHHQEGLLDEEVTALPMTQHQLADLHSHKYIKSHFKVY